MSEAAVVATHAEALRRNRQSLVFALWALPNAIMVALINVALPEIQADLTVPPSALTWASSGYIIAGAIGALIYGRLADVFGLRRVALFCMFAYVLTSVAVALAPSYAWVVACRIPQGLTGMALPTLGMAGVLLLLPPGPLRARAVGQMMAVFGVGVVLGSIGGGFVIAYTSWRAPFLIVAAIALALVPATLAALRTIRTTAAHVQLDKGGGLLITVAAGATLIAANQLPRPAGAVIGATALVVALVFWVLFLRHIRRVPSPFIDPVVLHSMPFLRACALGGMAQGQFVLAGFVLPLALKNLYGYSVAHIGILLSGGFIAVLVAGMAGGRIAAALGNRSTVVLAALISLAGAAGSTIFGMEHVPAAALMYVLLGTSYSLAQLVMINIAGRLLPPGYSGSGMGFYNFGYFAVGAFCVALAGGIIERRALADETWTRLHQGAATGYVDALLVLAALSVVGLVLLVHLWNDPGMARTSGKQES